MQGKYRVIDAENKYYKNSESGKSACDKWTEKLHGTS